MSTWWKRSMLIVIIGIMVATSLWAIGELYSIMPAGQLQHTDAAGVVQAAQLSQTSILSQQHRGQQRAELVDASTVRRASNGKQHYIGASQELGCLQLAMKSMPVTKAFEQCRQPQPEEENSSLPDSNEEQQGNYAGKVYLTFDDGPSKLTASVLDMLAEHHIKATFFVLGEKVKQYPELAKRIVEEGHSIGNHSYNHRYNELYESPEQFVNQLVETSETIYEVTGVVPFLFRAPGGSFGNMDRSYLKAVEDAGYMVYDWNVDSGDSRSREVTAEEIMKAVKESRVSDRMIVLLHDSATHGETVAALPEIIAYFQTRDYQFFSINEHTQPITSRLAETIKWNRKPLSDKQAKQLKERTAELRKKAEGS